MSKNTATKKKDSVWSPTVIIVAIVCAIALTVTVVFALIARSGYFRRNNIVMEIGENQISQIEFEYYYGAQYQYWASAFGLASSGVNIKTAKCYMDNTKTWHEYFVDQAKEAIVSDYLLAAEATKNNFEMKEASKKTLETLPDDIETAAEANSMSVNAYLSALYCRNLTMEDFVAFTTRSQLATDYAESVMDGYTYEDSEIEKYFTDHRKDFELAEYYYYTIKATEDKTVDAIVDEFKAISGEDSITKFKDKIKELNPDKVEEGKEFSYSSYLKTDATYTENNELLEWVFKEETKANDVTVIEVKSGEGDSATTTYTAVVLVNRGKDDSKVASMHHILFQAATKLDANGNELKDSEGKVQKDMDAAKAEAEKILAEFNKGDKSKESFVSFVEANTDDTASKYTEGLYENFAEGDMTDGINDWIFPEKEEDQPKVGDVANLATDYGYHLVYFLGYADAWKVDIENTMKNEAYEKYMEDLEAATSVKYNEENMAKVG